MNNEDKIIELLAEYLRKTDRLLERMDRQQQNFEEQGRRMDQHQRNFEEQGQQIKEQNQRMDLAYDVLIKHSEEMLELRKEAKKREIQQETILKEIFAISKRVQKLED
ncbi:MAG: hypothetical protein H7Z75_08030 [Ferruginibacter sp.]|nr:hypothetical protein [Cytophagales bacterium]